jgi:hypothetical protein
MSLAARDCRAKAVQCEEHAASANRFEVKVQHREFARQWRSMAERLERVAAQRASEERCQLAGSGWSTARCREAARIK